MDSKMYIFMGIGMVAIFVIAFAFSRVQAKKMGKQMDELIDFEKEHPNFSIVYYQMKSGLKDKVIHVHKINGAEYLSNQDATSLGMDTRDIYRIKHGEDFQQLVTGNKMGFYILPGKTVFNLSYVTSRAGVLYKSVTKYTDTVDFEVMIEANKSYMIDFNEKEKQFYISEIQD